MPIKKQLPTKNGFKNRSVLYYQRHNQYYLPLQNHLEPKLLYRMALKHSPKKRSE
jgi:hypothetical protein